MEAGAIRAVVFVPVLVLAVPVLVGIRRRREAIRHKLRRVVLVELAYMIVTLALIQAHVNPITAILAGMLTAILAARFMPARSRYVKRAARRKVIARFELKTGKKYSSKKHHIHHKVPFSDGGSNTEDNLEVLTAKGNLSRGAQPPWWDVIGRKRR
jgi:hypothetical protein